MRRDPAIVAANNANNNGPPRSNPVPPTAAGGSDLITPPQNNTNAIGSNNNSAVSMEALIGRSPLSSTSAMVTDYGGSSPTLPTSGHGYSTTMGPYPNTMYGSSRGVPDFAGDGGGGDDAASSVRSSRYSNNTTRTTMATTTRFTGDAGGGYGSKGNAMSQPTQPSQYYHPNAYMAHQSTRAFGAGGQAAPVPYREDERHLVGSGQGGSLPSCAILSLQLFLLLVASIIFLFGVTGNAEKLAGAEGWDEVFTVCGMLFIFPILIFLYRLVEPLIPRLSERRENRVWYWLFRFTLVGSFVLQSIFFLLYLVKYNGDWYYLFLLPDIIICLMMIVSTRTTTVWSYLYIGVMATKMGLFWFNLDPADGENQFQEKGNKYGINGFLALLMLNLPMVHYPVIISRLEAGMSMTDAYTTNMAAVFAHILHIMDSLELYMQGQTRRSFAADVQYLLLLFALMGFVSCSLYFITLFFRDEAAEKVIRRFQSNTLGEVETTKDESLLHYFLWTMIFIDLPYASMRFVAFCVHGNTILSPFFAKNITMIGSVLMLMFYNNVQHSRELKKTRGMATTTATM